MRPLLTTAERAELSAALGAERGRIIEARLGKLLNQYAAHHADMPRAEFNQHVKTLRRVFADATAALDEAPSDVTCNFYWARLREELATAVFDLDHVLFQTPKHRERDQQRTWLLLRLAESLASEGVRISQYESGPFGRCVRTALQAMDRITNKRYGGRRPAHTNIRPVLRTVSEAMRASRARTKEWRRLLDK